MQILNRNEMKHILAGSAPCYQTCTDILSACMGANDNHPSTDEYPAHNDHCMWLNNCCMAQCDGGGPGSC